MQFVKAQHAQVCYVMRHMEVCVVTADWTAYIVGNYTMLARGEVPHCRATARRTHPRAIALSSLFAHGILTTDSGAKGHF